MEESHSYTYHQFHENSNSNLRLTAGTDIPESTVKRINCQFSYIDFNNIELREYNENDDPEKSMAALNRFKTIMKDRNSIMIGHLIKEIDGLGPGTSGVQTEILSVDDKEKYGKISCVIKTKQGSIIPQPIVPGESYKGADNGFIYGNSDPDRGGGAAEDGDLDMSQASVYHTADMRKTGYNWRLCNVIYNSNFNHEDPGCIEKSHISQAYGVRSSTGYVTNENGMKNHLDTPIICTKEYECDLKSAEFVQGSCAICYEIKQCNYVNEGYTAEELRRRPEMTIFLSSNLQKEDKVPDMDVGFISQGDEMPIQIIIPKTGDIIASCGGMVSNGSLTGLENDLMPPLCKKGGNDKLDLLPMFVYPIYNGLVITNSILSNMENNTDSIFVQYSSTISNPLAAAEISGADMSTEIQQMIELDNSGEVMKWFPTLFQESPNKMNLKLKINANDRLRFSEKTNIRWQKCSGRFAYCPLFFQRKIKMTYYFKGEYIGDGETGGKYYFYPLVCSDIGDADADDWTGITKRGANCIGGDNVRVIYTDNDLQETVYAIDLEFEAKQYQRYPIEFFGMIAVYMRNKSQFSIENGNGRFKFNHYIRPQFSGALEEQMRNAANIQIDGDFPYLDLITHCSVSCSLDGVSGSLTMDGYPLDQGIKVLKQDQSIGQLNLAVSQHGTKYQLFKGYGMELTTNDSENNYGISLNLFGIDRKLSDMKLICAPFWDGDRLEAICAYMSEYANVCLKMIDHEVTSYDEDLPGRHAKPVMQTSEVKSGTWHASSETIVAQELVSHPDFRVPRSVDWRSPAINFGSGTTVMEALKTLGEKCSCVFCTQFDGYGTFYELNMLGYPYYVNNQQNVVAFQAYDIISINLAPALDNKYNSIATFGFLQKRDSTGRPIATQEVTPGTYYSRTNSGSNANNIPNVGVQFPWSRISVGVESGMYTAAELQEIHLNRVKAFISEIYKGTVTVPGNTMVNHIYQRITICGVPFFVISIDHDIDTSSKSWTVSYGIQCINVPDGNVDVQNWTGGKLH